MPSLSVIRSITLAAAVLAPALAHADSYLVQMTSSVVETDRSTGISGVMPLGSPVVMSFTVDSNNYLDSAISPARGYVIDPSSFMMTVNGTNVSVALPSPTYFGLRNNAPKVDGMFMGTGTTGGTALNATVDGLSQTFRFTYNESWSAGLELSSLNIADAVGTHGSAGLGSYQMDLTLNGSGASFNVPTVTISAVPEPATYGMMALGLVALVGVTRRRSAA